MVRTSVVIPTRRGTDPLKACLRALARTFPHDAETLVVCDGGPADLESTLTEFREPLKLRCIQAEHGGPSAARNRGLAEARGSIVAFTDDDCRPRDGWLTALCDAVSLSPPRAAGGTTVNGLASNRYSDAAQVVIDLVARHDRVAFGGDRFFPTNNCAFPIAPLRGVGGFDESFRTAEDRELFRRWRAAGFALSRTPAAVVDHDAGTDLSGFVRKFFAYGRGAARFHAAGGEGSLRDSAAFHMYLPRLVGAEMKRRGTLGAVSLAGLLAVWEVANLAGFLVESASGQTGSPVNGRRTGHAR